ncbi:STAS domain-containing protein [Streptomyces virginiae]|uniref:STAS domain-containing protein n=1 Tax=Streptomyces virginiae TaxID=1961 RepID=UPI00367B644B
MITVDVQHCSRSILLSVSGELDGAADETLRQALDGVTACERDILVDLHGVAVMDSHGLLHLLDLHRRAKCLGLGLRVLVTG